MSLTARRILTALWLKDALWRKAQAVPSLDLRFADSKSLVDSVSGQNLITYSRVGNASYIGSDGPLKIASANEPRFDHNPTTGESLGLLVEEQRTNLLLNSATLTTQSVTVTAVAHTLSFYGSGTVTLSGTSTAGPAVGSGAFPTRTTLTFTPTAGSLTLTVSGSATSAQLEAGSFATSYIPTTTAAATRAADVATITGTAFSSWYRQDEGTVYWEGTRATTTGYPDRFRFSDGTAANRWFSYWDASANSSSFEVTTGSLSQVAIFGGASSLNASIKVAFGVAANNASAVYGAIIQGTDTSVVVPSVSQLSIGLNLTGTIRRITYFLARLPNTTLQRLTQ